jgi:hypothetical protein
MIHIADITLDVPDFLLEGLTEADMVAVLENVANAARAKWIKLAGEKLFTTRRDYLRGIQQVEVLPGVQVGVALLGVLPNIVENGMEETDLRDTLLGPNVPVAPPGQKGKRQSKYKKGPMKGKPKPGAFHRAIPFRHATPGTSGAVGMPMGAAYAGHDAGGDSKKLGRKVYRAAKKLESTKGKPGGEVAYGGRLPEGMAPLLRPWHATDIYSGMIREEKTYEQATQYQYFTFRTISTEVRRGPQHWIRPATEGVRLAEEVSSFVGSIAEQSFAAYVEGMTT